jgi:dTMP kinase
MTGSSVQFIVFEGLDGAGTTTQAALLHRYFTQQGEDSFPTFEPTDGPVGTLIRASLEVAPGQKQMQESVLALLFAADRLDHSEQIRTWLTGGARVVCDRYVLSSMAYQSLDPAIPGERVVDLNRGCAVPDLTILLDVPVEVCLARLAARNQGRTIYEKSSVLRRIHENYAKLRPLYEEHFGEIASLDGTGTPEDIHRAVVELIGEPG